MGVLVEAFIQPDAYFLGSLSMLFHGQVASRDLKTGRYFLYKIYSSGYACPVLKYWSVRSSNLPLSFLIKVTRGGVIIVK